MPIMTKYEIIDEMVAEGYDYDTAYSLVFGDILNSNSETDEEA